MLAAEQLAQNRNKDDAQIVLPIVFRIITLFQYCNRLLRQASLYYLSAFFWLVSTISSAMELMDG